MDVVKKTANLTEGQGVDVCFDAAGVQVAVDFGLKSVKPRGTFVNIALWGAQRVTLDMIVMLFGERRYMASEYCNHALYLQSSADSFKLLHTSMEISRALSKLFTKETSSLKE